MLIGKLEIIIFEETVHEDDKLAHTGGHGDEWFLSRGSQTQIKLFEDAVMAHSTQSRHVERAAHRPTTAIDSSDSVLATTIAVVRGYARQCGGGLGGQLSEFRHFGQHGGRDHRADAGNGLQPFGLAGKFRVLGDDRRDSGIALVDLFFQGFAELPGLAEAEGIRVVLGVVAFHRQHLDELPATLGEASKLLLLGRGWGGGRRLERRAVFGQHGGVNGIGLGALALSAGEVTDAPGFHNANGDARGVEDAHDGLFVTTGGFANDVRDGINAQAFEQLGVTFGVIGHDMKTACEMELQRGLGNVEAGVEDV